MIWKDSNGSGQSPPEPNMSPRTTALAGKNSDPRTHWSMVKRAFPLEKPLQCIDSQNEFCRIYWPVIHLSLRHKHNFNHHDAEDLAQSFVTWVLEGDSLAKCREEKGRFRNFLLAHLDNFVRNHLQKENAQKRGGRATKVPITEASTESSLQDERTPDQNLQRAWSIATLREAHERIKKSYADKGKAHHFACLVPFLNAHEDESKAAQAAAILNMTLPAFRMARSRFRKEFGLCIADLVAATVDSEEEFAEEMALIREVAG